MFEYNIFKIAGSTFGVMVNLSIYETDYFQKKKKNSD